MEVSFSSVPCKLTTLWFSSSGCPLAYSSIAKEGLSCGQTTVPSRRTSDSFCTGAQAAEADYILWILSAWLLISPPPGPCDLEMCPSPLLLAGVSAFFLEFPCVNAR